jgi:hypothetical protein
MAASTGPILAAGGITFVNGWLFNNQAPNLKVLLATGIAALGLGLLSVPLPGAAEGIAWIALITVIFAPLNGQPAPAENLLKISGM